MDLPRELSYKAEEFIVFCQIGFSSEYPWIIPDTFMQNIIMGREYDQDLYKTVIESCDLSLDIESLPSGDNTIIGDSGVTLSGGQKARLSLARAIYSNHDFYLLDDPLSAVDSSVCLHLFHTIKKLSSEKIVILATHQTHFLPDSDRILVLNNGAQVFYGPPCDFSNASSGLASLIPIISTKTARVDTESNNTLADTPSEDPINEAKVNFKTYWKYAVIGNPSIALIVLVFCLMTLGQLAFYSWQYWCVLWIDSGESFSTYYISGMAVLVAATYFLYVLRIYFFNRMILNSNEALHNKAIEGLAKTDSRFFDIHSTGVLMVRFCKDMNYLNELMIKWLYDSVYLVFLIAATAIIQVIIMPYTAVVFPIWAILGYYVLHSFNPVILEMKGTELAIKGPLLTTYISILSGCPTIRSLSVTAHFLNIAREQSFDCYRASYAFQLVMNFIKYYVIMSISIVFIVNIIAITATKGLIDTTLAASRTAFLHVFSTKTSCLC